MALDRSNSSSLEQLALIGLINDLVTYLVFIQLSFQQMLDPECLQALRQLSDLFVSERSAVAEFSVLWRHDEGVSSKTHRDYLDDVASTAGTWLQQAVDLGVVSMAESWSKADSIDGQLLDEVRQHWVTVRDRVKFFTGRKDELNLVESYVLSDDDKPLVLHGSSGAGKSSVIAKIAAEVF